MHARHVGDCIATGAREGKSWFKLPPDERSGGGVRNQGQFNDSVLAGRFDSTRLRAVLFQRPVGTMAMIEVRSTIPHKTRCGKFAIAGTPSMVNRLLSERDAAAATARSASVILRAVPRGLLVAGEPQGLDGAGIHAVGGRRLGPRCGAGQRNLGGDEDRLGEAGRDGHRRPDGAPARSLRLSRPAVARSGARDSGLDERS
jgi:hypothetical protein